MLGQLIELQEADRKEWQLLYYKPVNDKARQIHLSSAKTVGVGGGNGSSKTETCLVIMVMLATGVIPLCFREDPEVYEAIRAQMRGPVNCRVVCESLTTVLHPIMLPKLRWNSWDGIDQPGGDRGHWGWIPKRCLIGGAWEKAWSEKLRTLKLYHLDPDNYDKVLGQSSIQFMSYDQDSEDFASGNFHMILHDEPPTWPIWRENEARTMRVNGRMFCAMTWPDDPAINVDWLFDEVYEKGQFGSPNKHEDIDWFNLWTTENPHLDQEAVSIQASKWGREMTNVRVFGGTIRFSNRVHQGFVDEPRVWCFTCKEDVHLVQGKCPQGCPDICAYNHVEHQEWERNWPVVWLLDPHPRKPHMFMWVGINPGDDWHVLRADECSGDPVAVAELCKEIEDEYEWVIARRMIDPNMGRSPSGVDREIRWQDEFDRAGLVTDLSDDSAVGRKRVDQMLIPDEATYRPRLTFEPGLATEKAVHQMKRYMWSDYSLRIDRGQKQTPRDKYDDYPTLLKYLANSDPSFGGLAFGAPVLRRPVRGMDSRARQSVYSRDRLARR